MCTQGYFDIWQASLKFGIRYTLEGMLFIAPEQGYMINRLVIHAEIVLH